MSAGLGSAPARDWTTVRIGTEGAYRPFNYFTPSGELAGFDVEIAKALCRKMNVECSFVAQDWDGIIPALLAGRYDAIVASLAITEERKAIVAFTDPYYRTKRRFVAATAITDVSPEGMNGKVIGAQSSTTNANFLDDIYVPAGAVLRLYPTLEDAQLDLAAGRLDAVLAGTITIFDWLASPEGACCAFIGPEINRPDYFGEGMGIAVRKEDDDLRAMFNEALRAILADGTYEELSRRYFSENIY